MPRSGKNPPSQASAPPTEPLTAGPESAAAPGAEGTGRFQWRPEYSVGIEEIDAQHQELFRRAGLFIDGLTRRSRQEIGILLSFLRLHAVTHFGAEEAWMRASSYPGLAEHERQHDGFIKDILALSDQHEKKTGRGLEPARVSGWLEKWLRDHVTSTDTDFARHLKATGVPPPPPEPEEPPVF